MYNADGSEGKMCGNGIRCVAKYVYDNKMTDKTTITVETLSGIKTLELNVKNDKVETVKVNMGTPICYQKMCRLFLIKIRLLTNLLLLMIKNIESHVFQWEIHML